MNLQLVEKPVCKPNGELDIVDIWHTIQGEGPFAGTPAVFIRMAGCLLQCPSCDTDYTSNRKLMPVREIMMKVYELMPGHKTNLIVLTGGEPLRQNLIPFLRSALRSFRVQIETAGTGWPDGLKMHHDSYNRLTIVCSPKTPTIKEELYCRINCFKYIIQAGQVDPMDGLPTTSLGMSGKPFRPDWTDFYSDEIFVQPCDEGDEMKNRDNIRAAVESCMKFGYRICLQQHKILGVP
jgi:7-carboxy-7-deazaguanine synthase